MPAIHTPTAVTWVLNETVARMGTARLDLEVPAHGIAAAGPDAPDQLLGLDLRMSTGKPTALTDYWARGDDVVAVYKPADPRRLTATAMWRAVSGAHAAWELILSAQTALVESDASLAITCDVASGEIVVGREIAGTLRWSALAPSVPCPADATCALIRRDADAVLVAVHPTDARRIVVVEEAGRVQITCWLFSSVIEKGVLLRGRVVAAIGPAGDAPHWADDRVLAFAASPPLLTA